MAKVDRSILQANDQNMGDFGDPNKLEASISHLADKIDLNDDETQVLKTDNSSNKWRLTTLEGDVSTLKTDNTNNKSRLTANESNIAYNEGRLVELLRSEQKASEVVDARMGFPVLREKLENVDSRFQNLHVDLVKDYGHLKVAVTDGYDWSPALQAAINNLPKGKIYIPTGNYDFYSKVSLNKSSVTIEGAGMANTVLISKFNGEMFESNNGAWNGTTYTKGFGSALSSIVYKDITLDGGNYSNSIGIRFAKVTRGSRIENVKFRNFAKANIFNECWDFSVINAVYETNTLGMEIDCENNNFLILHAVFNLNKKHIDMPGVLGTNRKLSIVSSSLDGIGINGGCTFKGTTGLTLRDIYMEVYPSDDPVAKSKNFLEFGTGLLMTSIVDCHMISPNDSSYSATWLYLSGGNGYKIDGNYQLGPASKLIDATGAGRVTLGANRVEGSLGTLPAPNVLTNRSESVRFPSTTTTAEWRMIVCRTRNSAPIPRVSLFFDSSWTPAGQKLRIIRNDNSAVLLDVELPRRVINPYEEINMGSLTNIEDGVLLQAYLYKIGSSISTPAGTIIIDQY